MKRPDWNKIIVDQGWKIYIESIRKELERTIGKTVIATQIKLHPSTVAFWCKIPIFDVDEVEYEKNNAYGRRKILRWRWVDFYLESE